MLATGKTPPALRPVPPTDRRLTTGLTTRTHIPPTLTTRMPPTPSRLRKAYVNREHPVVVLRFEDGHEIRVQRGKVKTFDAYSGEIVKIVAVYDPTSSERDLL